MAYHHVEAPSRPTLSPPSPTLTLIADLKRGIQSAGEMVHLANLRFGTSQDIVESLHGRSVSTGKSA